MPDSMKGLDVMVAGEVYVDLILAGFDAWPRPGQEVFAREYERAAGGAAITAYGLAKLGSRTGIFAVFGADTENSPLDELKRCGVDTQDIHLDSSEPTGLTVAVTSPEERAYFTYPGANRRFPVALMDAARERQFARARHVHLSWAPSFDIAHELFDGIRKSGCTISLDTGWHESWLRDSRALDVLAMVDLFLPNEMEAAQITGDDDPRNCLRKLAAAGVNRVALKLGPRGAALSWDGDILFAAPRQVTPIDTTGAGDCFDAGFLHAWLDGQSPKGCLRIANVCGALSTEARGGIAGFPSRSRLNEELKGQSCGR